MSSVSASLIATMALLLMAAPGASLSARQSFPDVPGAAGKVAAPPSATSLSYPQSLFVDSRHGNIWVADFDNNRVLRFDVSSLTSAVVPDPPAVPDAYRLRQNYPNPFNPRTTIIFALRTSEYATVKVHDVLGREVAVLFDGMADARKVYALSFEAKDLPGGVYFYSLRSREGIECRKMALIR